MIVFFNSSARISVKFFLNDCITIRHRNTVYCFVKKKFKKNLILVNIEINVLKPIIVHYQVR
jgi:hypothetical protein